MCVSAFFISFTYSIDDQHLKKTGFTNKTAEFLHSLQQEKKLFDVETSFFEIFL